MNFYEIYFVVIWTSYSKILDKIKYIFSLMIGNKKNITFNEFWFVFQNTISGFKKMFKGKMRLKWNLLELAAKKAFKSADIKDYNALRIDDVEQWIIFNKEFELFLHAFDSPDSYFISRKVFKPFLYDIDFEYFDKQTLNTQRIKNDIMKSLSNRHRGVLTHGMIALKKAHGMLKNNNTKFNHPPSSESEVSEGSFDSLEKDPVIKRFLRVKSSRGKFQIYNNG
jgi:hypothetical protein